MRGGEHLGRGGAGVVRVGGRRAQHLGGELGDDVDEHLLVLGRGQVEDAARRRGRRRGRPAAAPARAGERAAGRRRGPEPAAGHGEDGLLGLLAQPDPVEQVALGQPVQRGDGVADRVARLVGWRCRCRRRAGGSWSGTCLKCNSELHFAATAARGCSRSHAGATDAGSLGSAHAARAHRSRHAPYGPLPDGGTRPPDHPLGHRGDAPRQPPVTAYDDDLRALAADMVATMYAADGVGLAACQVGVDLAMFVFDCPDASGRAHGRRGLQPGRDAARGQGPPARRGRRGLPLAARRLRAAGAARLRHGRRLRAGRRAGDVQRRRPAGPAPAARDRPHLRHRLRRPAVDQLAQEAAEGARQGGRPLPRRLAGRRRCSGRPPDGASGTSADDRGVSGGR